MDKCLVYLYFEIYIWPDLYSSNGISNRHSMYHKEVFMLTPSCGKIIFWYLLVQESTKSGGEGSRSNVYLLSLIISYAGFPKNWSFSPCIEVMHDWRARKRRNQAECFVFISNHILGALQWQMKFKAYLLDNAAWEVETDE